MKLRQFLPIFSYIFHPIFISLYGTLFYFLVVPSGASFRWQYLTVIQIVIITVLLPLVLYFLLISMGKASSFTEATIKERQLPIFIQILLFSALLFFKDYFYARELFFFFVGGFISAFMALIAVFLRFKASLHMIGITSLATFIYCLVRFYNLPFINTVALVVVCMGLVASSRLFMKSHTPTELVIGSLIGLASQLIAWRFFMIYSM